MYWILKDQDLGWADVGVGAIALVVFIVLYILVNAFFDH